MDSFKQYLLQHKQESRELLSQWVKQELSRFDSYLPGSMYLEKIPQYLISGGKFGRPLLSKLAYSYTSKKSPSSTIEKAVLSVELFHRFILVHDDIIDGDLSRHGHPTLEKVYRSEDNVPSKQADWWGKSMAMIAGDIVHSLTQQVIFETDLAPEIKIQILQALHDCLVQTALGWRLETKLKTEPIDSVSISEVEQAMNLVSVEYSVLWPLRIGQLLAGLSSEWDESLEIYGNHIGMAFQIQDDILGIFGDPKITGKPIGSDIRESKKTHLIMHAYETANTSQRKTIENLMGQDISATDLDDIKQIMTKTGSLAYAQKEIDQHFLRGTNALKSSKQTDSSEKLFHLAEYLCRRDH